MNFDMWDWGKIDRNGGCIAKAEVSDWLVLKDVGLVEKFGIWMAWAERRRIGGK